MCYCRSHDIPLPLQLFHSSSAPWHCCIALRCQPVERRRRGMEWRELKCQPLSPSAPSSLHRWQLCSWPLHLPRNAFVMVVYVATMNFGECHRPTYRLKLHRSILPCLVLQWQTHIMSPFSTSRHVMKVVNNSINRQRRVRISHWQHTTAFPPSNFISVF
jgi:hypothetical protein